MSPVLKACTNGARRLLRDRCPRVLVELSDRPAPDNAALVRAARAVVTACDAVRAGGHDVGPAG